MLFFLFLAGSAYAQPQCTALIYTGAPFSSLVTTGANFTPLVPLTGTITLSAPLPANAQSLAVTPTAWNFTAEGPNLNSVYWYEEDAGYAPATFTFSTDADGNITKWNFYVWWGIPTGGGQAMSATSSAAGDNVGFSYTYIGSPPPNSGSITGISATPGKWTCDPPPAPNPLAAQVAQLQAQVTSLQSQLQWQTYYAAYWKDAWVNVELQLEALKK